MVRRPSGLVHTMLPSDCGAAVQGGVGTIGGAIIGGLIIGVLNNGMSIMGIGIEWQQAVKGLVLLLAVAFDVYNKRRSGN